MPNHHQHWQIQLAFHFMLLEEYVEYLLSMWAYAIFTEVTLPCCLNLMHRENIYITRSDGFPAFLIPIKICHIEQTQ